MVIVIIFIFFLKAVSLLSSTSNCLQIIISSKVYLPSSTFAHRDWKGRPVYLAIKEFIQVWYEQYLEGCSRLQYDFNQFIASVALKIQSHITDLFNNNHFSCLQLQSTTWDLITKKRSTFTRGFYSITGSTMSFLVAIWLSWPCEKEFGWHGVCLKAYTKHVMSDKSVEK